MNFLQRLIFSNTLGKREKACFNQVSFSSPIGVHGMQIPINWMKEIAWRFMPLKVHCSWFQKEAFFLTPTSSKCSMRRERPKGEANDFTGWCYFQLLQLNVACPCTLVQALPKCNQSNVRNKEEFLRQFYLRHMKVVDCVENVPFSPEKRNGQASSTLDPLRQKIVSPKLSKIFFFLLKKGQNIFFLLQKGQNIFFPGQNAKIFFFFGEKRPKYVKKYFLCEKIFCLGLELIF